MKATDAVINAMREFMLLPIPDEVEMIKPANSFNAREFSECTNYFSSESLFFFCFLTKSKGHGVYELEVKWVNAQLRVHVFSGENGQRIDCTHLFYLEDLLLTIYNFFFVSSLDFLETKDKTAPYLQTHSEESLLLVP